MPEASIQKPRYFVFSRGSGTLELSNDTAALTLSLPEPSSAHNMEANIVRSLVSGGYAVGTRNPDGKTLIITASSASGQPVNMEDVVARLRAANGAEVEAPGSRWTGKTIMPESETEHARLTREIRQGLDGALDRIAGQLATTISPRKR